jgi:transposase
MTRRATKASKVILTKDERDYLERLVRRRKVSRGEAQRAEIVLCAANGLNNRAISDAVGVARDTVRLWRERFAKHRLDGLDDEPRCGAPRKIGDDRIEQIITMTLETKPADATHWSTRGMAKASGVSTSSVQRIWRAFSLQPHRAETFKLSSDPQFVEKVRDIVGLYLDPPDKALSSASMRKARSRLSIALSRCCRCVPGKWSGARMTTCAMAPQRCSQVLSRR